MDKIERKHNTNTYKRLANLSRNLRSLPEEVKQAVSFYDSATESYSSLLDRLEKHKENSIVGIVRCVDNLLGELSVAEEDSWDKLEGDCRLLIEQCIPSKYSGQADIYNEILESIICARDESLNNNVYAEAA